DAPQFNSEQNSKMQKCNLCYERLKNNQQTVCVEACPMYALDIGIKDNLKEKYGDNVEAIGFNYSEKIKPSIVFKIKE
ncbi:MAG: 4Fe-4S dicluster domain-containing protein, partial [Candidatus Heimdallarchaeota archaeon]